MRRTTALFLLLWVVAAAVANPIDKQQARQLAAQFMANRGAQLKSEPMRAPGRKAVSEQAPLYIFNAEGNEGFVVVSGDDRAMPILGYTDRGSYDEETMPDNFRWWMENVAREIELLDGNADGNVDALTVLRERAKANAHKAITPLLVTEWNQGSATEEGYIYNTLCPTVNGKHCITGCVATAGAQIMYYYQWPQKATSVVPGYTIDGNSADTSKDLPAITFDWAKMKPTYSSADQGTASAKAVAELMLYCGYAARMNYGLGGSGAATGNMVMRMAQFFDYDPYTYRIVERSDYTIGEWNELIYEELAASRPIIYSGDSFSGGHAFICDGYDGEGLYHFNWGWGGSYNGYFTLQATNPYLQNESTSVGYIFYQDAYIGIQPNTGAGPINDPNQNDEWEEELFDGILPTAQFTNTEGALAELIFWNRNEETYSFGFGIGELNDDGTITVVDNYYEFYQRLELSKGSGYNVSFDLSAYKLSEGYHKLVPISLLKGETEWRRCNPASIWFDVTVDSTGVKTIVAHPVDNLEFTRFEALGSCLPGQRLTFVFDVNNNGDNYNRDLFLLQGTENNAGKYVNGKTVKIKAGNTKSYRIPLYDGLDEGTYTFRLATDSRGKNVLATTTVIIKQSLRATDFEVPGFHLATSVQQVNVTVENSGGEYIYPLYLFASKTTDKGTVAYATGTAIRENSSEQVLFYFQPKEAGTWNLWVCTDEEGKNVIGQSTVEIIAAPKGDAKLEASNLMLTPGTTTTYTMTITNNGKETYYNDIVIWLYKYDANTNSFLYERNISSKKLGLDPGKSTPLAFNINNLEEGEKYMIYCYYYFTFYTDNNIRTDYIEIENVRKSFTVTATGIDTITTDTADDAWYTLDGKKLNAKPTSKGIYVHRGKKIVM